MTKYHMEFQLSWRDAGALSQEGLNDEIIIGLNTKVLGDEYLFAAPTDFTTEVPPQNSDDAIEQEVKSSAAGQGATAVGAAAGTAIARLLLVGSLS